MTETPDLFSSTPRIVNVGSDLFADALEAQGAPVSRVSWQPAQVIAMWPSVYC